MAASGISHQLAKRQVANFDFATVPTSFGRLIYKSTNKSSLFQFVSDLCEPGEGRLPPSLRLRRARGGLRHFGRDDVGSVSDFSFSVFQFSERAVFEALPAAPQICVGGSLIPFAPFTCQLFLNCVKSGGRVAQKWLSEEETRFVRRI